MKLANKAEQSVAESVERRARPREMQSTATRALDSAPAQVHQALDCMRIVDPSLPKVGAVCGKAARTVLCGGRSAMSVPTAIGLHLLHLLTAGFGTTRLFLDVRDDGEYWRVSGPASGAD